MLVPFSTAACDEDHGTTGVEQRPLRPIAIQLLDSEANLIEAVDKLFDAPKADFVFDDYHLSRGEEDVVSLQANSAITHINHLKPALHRPVG